MVRLPGFLCVAIAAGLAGCATLTRADQEVAPVVGPAPRMNTTPMATALACVAGQRSPRDLRIGVSDFVDGTGVMEGGTQNSRAVTQRPDLMMVTALAAAGAHLVNRSSVNVAEWELNKAMEKKLGDGHPELIDHKKIDFRPVRTGIILGSTHYVTGAVTELNWNIDSGVAEAGAYSLNVGRRTYRISVAVDVVVTDSQTTEIVFAKSYKKQLVGFENTANFFRFVSDSSAAAILSSGAANAAALTQELQLFDANLDQKDNEPTQTALRWVIELAGYDIMRTLKHTGSSCDTLLPPATFDNGVLPPDVAAAAAAASPLPPSSSLAAAAPQKVADTSEMALARVPDADNAGAPAAQAVAVALPPHPVETSVASEPNPAPPAAPGSETPAKEAAAKPQRTDVSASLNPEPPAKEVAAKAEDTNARVSPAAVRVKAARKPVIAARSETRAPKLAETQPVETSAASGPNPAPWGGLAGVAAKNAAAEAAQPGIPVDPVSAAAGVKVPAPRKPVVLARAEASQPAPKCGRSSSAQPASCVTSSAPAPAARGDLAEATPSASTEKSDANAPPPAQGSGGAAPIHWTHGSMPWINGSMPALAADLSPRESAGSP